MYTIDRINSLLARLDLPTISASSLQLMYPYRQKLDGAYGPAKSYTPAHDVLDQIDKHCGIITRFMHDGSLAPLGDRIRRLERHLDSQRCRPYFWGGAHITPPALTS